MKTVKNLVVAASPSGRLDNEQLDRGLLELRHAPRADGRSPAQVVFGHPLRPVGAGGDPRVAGADISADGIAAGADPSPQCPRSTAAIQIRCSLG